MNTTPDNTTVLEKILAYYGMPQENISNAVEQIAETYGACRFLHGVQLGAEAVNELGEESRDADKAMKELDEKIALAKKSWEGVDVDEFMDEVRGKDLTLTWEDASTIVTIAMDIIGEGKIVGEQNIYTEVLRLFNERRENR